MQKRKISQDAPIINAPISISIPKVAQLQTQLLQLEILKTKKMELFVTASEDISKLSVPIYLFNERENQQKKRLEMIQGNSLEKENTTFTDSNNIHIPNDDIRDVETIEGARLKEEGNWARFLKFGGLAAKKIVQLSSQMKQGLFNYQYGIFTTRVLRKIFSFELPDIYQYKFKDFRSRALPENTNASLVSALVFAVWISFLTNIDKPSEEDTVSWLYLSYSIIWALASSLSIFSILLSIMMIWAININESDDELENFYRLLQDITVGFGAHSPVLFLNLSILFGGIGSFIWYLQKYAYSITTYAGIASICLVGVIYIILKLSIISCLICIGESFSVIEKLPNTVIILDPKDIEELFSHFLKHLSTIHPEVSSNRLIELIESPQEFVDFVTAKTSGLKFGKLTLIKMKVFVVQKMKKVISKDYPHSAEEFRDEYFF